MNLLERNAIYERLENQKIEIERLRTVTPEMVERARRAFGDALATRVNMNIRLGDVPVQVLREAMAEALVAAHTQGDAP